MTTTLAFQDGPDALAAEPEAGTQAAAAGRRWRSIWRLHFYAAIFVAPMLVMMALTGLVIMYTQPINEWADGSMTRVADTGATVSLQQQKDAAEKAFPYLSVTAVNMARDGGVATTFVMGNDDKSATREVFVNPHTGEITGSKLQGNDLVGLANRLHGTFNNDSRTQLMPSVKGIFFGGDEKFVDVPVGDMLLEVLACWGIALAATGLYLWWPRQRQAGKSLLIPRRGKTGRARWRDLHAASGIVLSVILLFFLVTGLPWSAFWGENWRAVASKATPNAEGEATGPESTLARPGDIDRLGQRVPWVAAGTNIPVSTGGDAHHDEGGGTAAAAAGDAQPAMVSLDVVAKAADEHGMHAGYLIAMPANEKGDDGTLTYGSFMLTNYWPSRVNEEQTVYLDQFTGKDIQTLPADHYGALPWATSAGIQTHMGTQFGLANRIVMTTACLLLLFSVFSGAVMWWKRRPTGTAGFPRRPVKSHLERNVAIIAVVLALLYPLWGLSVLLILAIDHLVVRRLSPLRQLFGMRDRPSPPAPAAPAS
jgi:uncharacterized iron-regulated membrane protein